MQTRKSVSKTQAQMAYINICVLGMVTKSPFRSILKCLKIHQVYLNYKPVWMAHASDNQVTDKVLLNKELHHRFIF